MKATKKQLDQSISKLDQTKAIELLSETFNYPNKVLALAIELDLTLSDAIDSINEDSDELFTIDGKEYRILNDSEAEQMNDEYIENYIDDCIMPELPEPYRRYFDTEAFKRACAYDGRGHNLATYDGIEIEQKINGEWLYIYRTN